MNGRISSNDVPILRWLHNVMCQWSPRHIFPSARKIRRRSSWNCSKFNIRPIQYMEKWIEAWDVFFGHFPHSPPPLARKKSWMERWVGGYMGEKIQFSNWFPRERCDNKQKKILVFVKRVNDVTKSGTKLNFSHGIANLRNFTRWYGG